MAAHARSGWRRWFPDLAGYGSMALRRDAQAGVAVALLGIPQAVAYSTITGLPPAMGLYAAAVPAIVGALARGSPLVITGPTNAVSLLVGAAVAVHEGRGHLAVTATELSVLVGALQVGAGLAGLGSLVDFLSSAVVLGYLTGAGALIAVAQLPTVLGVQGGVIHPAAAVVAAVTAAFLVWQRARAPRLPGPLLVMVAGVLLATLFPVDRWGVAVVADVASVPVGLPPLAVPPLRDLGALLPGAVAVAFLSLVESNSVARRAASRQRVRANVDFVGQGLANVASGLFGGYPTSGSVSQTALNAQAGAVSRLSGLLSGVAILAVLAVAAPAVDRTPLAVLGALLLVVAWGLIDRRAIATVLRSDPADAAAFLATLAGTFLLRLDHAIYLGIAVSLVLFLRRSRLLLVQELVVNAAGRLQERPLTPTGDPDGCHAVRILQVEGTVFFGAAGELRDVLLDAPGRPRALVVRLRRARGLDYTAAAVLDEVHGALAQQGRHLLLVGPPEPAVDLLTRTGIAADLGDDLLVARPGWFGALHDALQVALDEVGDHACHAEGCPLRRYLSSTAA